MDPYQVLGVAKTASQDEIKDAYRKLAKKLHPDLNPGNKNAEKKFKEVSVAYDRIGTPENRAKQDRGEFDEVPPWGPGAGAQHRQGPFYYRTQGQGFDQDAQQGRYHFNFGGGGAGGGGDFDEDLFEQLFGASAGRARGARGGARRGDFKFPGEDTLYSMQVDLKDATLGAEREITLPSGKRLAVKIPSGVTSGTKLRFAGQGELSASGGPPGDAYVEIQVRDDPRFKRQGDELVLEQAVSLTQAVFGGEVRVPTLEGAVLLKIPPRSNSGTRLRIPRKGVYNRASASRGDEIVVLRIVLPDRIDPELEEALRQWQARHPESSAA